MTWLGVECDDDATRASIRGRQVLERDLPNTRH